MPKTSTSWAKGQSGNPAGRPKSAFHSILKDMMKDIAFNPYHGREATRARELIMQNLITVAATGNFECPTGGTRQVSDKVWLSVTRLLIKLLGDVDEDNPSLPTRTKPDPFIEKTRAAEPHKTAHVSRFSPTYLEPDPPNPSTSSDLPVSPDLLPPTDADYPSPTDEDHATEVEPSSTDTTSLPVLPDLSHLTPLLSLSGVSQNAPHFEGGLAGEGVGEWGDLYVSPDLSASGDLPSPRKGSHACRHTGVPRKCEAFVGWCGVGVGGGVYPPLLSASDLPVSPDLSARADLPSPHKDINLQWLAYYTDRHKHRFRSTSTYMLR